MTSADDKVVRLSREIEKTRIKITEQQKKLESLNRELKAAKDAALLETIKVISSDPAEVKGVLKALAQNDVTILMAFLQQRGERKEGSQTTPKESQL